MNEPVSVSQRCVRPLATVPDAVMRFVVSWLDFADHCRFAACQRHLDALARHPTASSPNMAVHIGGDDDDGGDGARNAAPRVCVSSAPRLRASPRALTVHVMRSGASLSCATIAACGVPGLESLCIFASPGAVGSLDCRTLRGLRTLVRLDTRGAYLANEEALHDLPQLRDLVVRGRDRNGACNRFDLRGRLAQQLESFDLMVAPPSVGHGLLSCKGLVSLAYTAWAAASQDKCLRLVLTHLPALERLAIRRPRFRADALCERALTESVRSSRLRRLALLGCVMAVRTGETPSLVRRIAARMCALEQLEITYDTEWPAEDEPGGLVGSEDTTPLGALPHLTSLHIDTGQRRTHAGARDESHYGLGEFPALQELALSADYPLAGLVAPKLRRLNERELASWTESFPDIRGSDRLSSAMQVDAIVNGN